MNGWFAVDWGAVLLPDTPLAEIFVRGTVIYLALFTLLRVVVKREAGTLNITNLLVIVLLADAVQNGMAGEYHSVADGVLLVITILFWSYLLDWLGYRFPRFQRLVHSPPLMLVRDGQMIRKNMRQELITKEELMELIREQGLDDLKQVKAAYLEGNGRMSVISQNGEQHVPPETAMT